MKCDELGCSVADAPPQMGSTAVTACDFAAGQSACGDHALSKPATGIVTE